MARSNRKAVTTATPILTRTSRAVARQVEAGNTQTCVHCEQSIKFKAREKRWRVIANVYKDGVWQRVEHWHLSCYKEAGEPYGGVEEN